MRPNATYAEYEQGGRGRPAANCSAQGKFLYAAAAEKDEMPSQVAAGLKIFPRGKQKAGCMQALKILGKSIRSGGFTCKQQPPGDGEGALSFFFPFSLLN